MHLSPSKSHTARYCALVLTFLLIVCLSFGCTSRLTGAPGNKTFQEFTNELFQQEVSSNTISLHYTLKNPKDYGILDAPVTYGSFSTDSAGTMAALENCKAALGKFSYKKLSAKNQLTYDVLNSYLETAIKGAPYQLYDEPLSPLTGIQAQLPVLLSEFQLNNASDIDTYLNLMETTPDYFQSLNQFESVKSDHGLFMSETSADAIIKECSSFIDMGQDNYLYSTFTERLEALEELTEEQRASYEARNQEVIQNSIFPAYDTLIQTLSALRGSGKNSSGLCYYPEGKAYYEYVVERETGSSRSVSELKQLTKSQILADLTAMQSILKSSSDSAAETARQNQKALSLSEPSVILDDLQDKITETFPKAPNVDTTIKYVPDIMEEYLSPAFYMIPAIDNTARNVIYINQGRTMEGLELYTTLAHEGYPGHLYQTIYYASLNPDPVRNILNFGGYVEGWATYAEMCSYYLAPLEKSQAALLQKNNSVILGLYALADIGIHDEGWTLSETAAFFNDYGISDASAIQSIYQLILGDPANYLKYYIGYVEFLELKKEAVKKWGNGFTQERFHKAVLNVGPAPFDVVEKYALE